MSADGAIALRWSRRARGAWSWPDGVDAPLNEQSEAYSVGIGDPSSPELVWNVSESRLDLNATAWADLVAAHPGQPVWVRQVGAASLSDPLFLAAIA